MVHLVRYSWADWIGRVGQLGTSNGLHKLDVCVYDYVATNGQKHTAWDKACDCKRGMHSQCSCSSLRQCASQLALLSRQYLQLTVVVVQPALCSHPSLPSFTITPLLDCANCLLWQSEYSLFWRGPPPFSKWKSCALLAKLSSFSLKRKIHLPNELLSFFPFLFRFLKKCDKLGDDLQAVVQSWLLMGHPLHWSKNIEKIFGSKRAMRTQRWQSFVT